MQCVGQGGWTPACAAAPAAALAPQARCVGLQRGVPCRPCGQAGSPAHAPAPGTAAPRARSAAAWRHGRRLPLPRLWTAESPAALRTACTPGSKGTGSGGGVGSFGAGSGAGPGTPPSPAGGGLRRRHGRRKAAPPTRGGTRCLGSHPMPVDHRIQRHVHRAVEEIKLLRLWQRQQPRLVGERCGAGTTQPS